jgi:hypothetical protein
MKTVQATALVALLTAAVSFGQTKQVDTMRGVNRGQAKPPAAILMVGINESVGSIAEPGWPLVVSVTKAADDVSTQATLPSNLQLKVTSENGATVSMAFTPVPLPATNTTAATLFWLAAESATTSLPAGRYSVSVAPLTGWQMESGNFQIVPRAPANTRLLRFLKLHRSVLSGQTDNALAEADQLIAASDHDKEAWIAKGDIFMLKDQPDEALQAFDRALSLHKKTDREPIAIMTRRRAAFMRSLEKRGVLPAQKQP